MRQHRPVHHSQRLAGGNADAAAGRAAPNPPQEALLSLGQQFSLSLSNAFLQVRSWE